MLCASRHPIVGLDIGSSSVKMVSLRSNGDGYHVTGAVMEQVESDNNRAVVDAIRNCLRSGKKNISRGSNFVFGLSGAGVKIHSFSFTNLTLEEIAQAVMFEAAQVCPFDIRSSVVDYQLININGKDASEVNVKKKKIVHDQVTGVLAVATNELATKHRKFADDAAIKCVLMDSEAMALLNCVMVNHPDNNELPTAVINVGNTVTTVAILGSDGLPFIRDLGHSGKDMIKSMAKTKGVSFEAMLDEVSAGRYGGCNDDEISHACSRLIMDVCETLEYYASRHDINVNKIYVCGGFGLLTDFVRELSESIANDVSILDPFENMNVDEGAIDEETASVRGPAFAVAAGLAMRQV